MDPIRNGNIYRRRLLRSFGSVGGLYGASTFNATGSRTRRISGVGDISDDITFDVSTFFSKIISAAREHVWERISSIQLGDIKDILPDDHRVVEWINDLLWVFNEAPQLLDEAEEIKKRLAEEDDEDDGGNDGNDGNDGSDDGNDDDNDGGDSGWWPFSVDQQTSGVVAGAGSQSAQNNRVASPSAVTFASIDWNDVPGSEELEEVMFSI